jgi:hypothetical protein
LVGETIGKRVERKEVASRTCPLKMARIGGRPRVMRDHHSAVITSPKAVRWSRDRGCNDHRILRRVPIDRRHSGSSRGIGFHETVSTVVLVISASSDPYVSNSSKGENRANGEDAALTKVREAEDEPEEVTTGMSEARSHQRRGKKTPTLGTNSKKGRETRSSRSKDVLNVDPPKRSRTS